MCDGYNDVELTGHRCFWRQDAPRIPGGPCRLFAKLRWSNRALKLEQLWDDSNAGNGFPKLVAVESASTGGARWPAC
jgi:hypothetical protein